MGNVIIDGIHFRCGRFDLWLFRRFDSICRRHNRSCLRSGCRRFDTFPRMSRHVQSFGYSTWVVWGKPNHLLVHRISSKVRCVFSTSKLATKGPQMSVLSDNEENRTNSNIKRTTNSRLFRSGWFALYDLFSKANRRCLQTEPGGSLYLT